MHMNMAVLLGYQDDLLGTILDIAIRVRDSDPEGAHFVLVLRSDGEPETEQAKQASRRLAMERGIPVFDEPADAARALACLRTYERFCAVRGLHP
jgi:acyl-CoA synthetase (NDP forming)